MTGSVAKFQARPTGEVHPAYEGSVLSPVAPEYTTGEVLLAAAYRRLLLGERDTDVHLEDIRGLADALSARAHEIDAALPNEARAAFHDAWAEIATRVGGLASPAPGGQTATTRLPQLMPLVPQIGRFAGVLGKYGRSRWEPGNLLLSAIFAGKGPSQAAGLLRLLCSTLAVDNTDDVLARYVEDCLQALPREHGETVHPPTIDELVQDGLDLAPAWRRSHDGHTPSERFVADLEEVLRLKQDLTRRQWTVLLEAQLRLGLATHQLWLCRLNTRVWELAKLAMDGKPASATEVESLCWRPQEADDPLLELGQNAIPAVRRMLAAYAEARLGLNLLLHALEDAGKKWSQRLGVGDPSAEQAPGEALASFLSHVAASASLVEDTLRQAFKEPSITAAAGSIVDRYPRLLSAQQGVTRNLLFFVRHSLGQLQPVEKELRPYDQAFLLYRQDAKGDKWFLQPAPAALILLVHSCCQALGKLPASMDDLRRHLSGYGIASSIDELRSGAIVRDLEQLGLVVDSPDAGGGRLLVDPLRRREASNA